MRGAQRPLVSVVTPVYNGAAYLSECIESVLAQSYEHWDYTIIDNCSTDESLDIARRYAARDRRIRIHQNPSFLNAISNHNVAVRQTSLDAKYCKVVFADDLIFPECLSEMVAVGEEYPSVGLVGAYCLQGQQVICAGLPYPTRWVSGHDVCRRHMLEGLYVFGSANSVLYRADGIRRRAHLYNESNIHADTEACVELLKDSDFGFVHQVLTLTRVRPGSLTSMSEQLQTDLAGMLELLLKHGPYFLTEEELSDRVRRCVSAYYRFLGKSVLLGRDRTFWQYHKRRLIELGVGLHKSRVARAALLNVCVAALDPVGTVGALSRRTRRRPGAPTS